MSTALSSDELALSISALPAPERDERPARHLQPVTAPARRRRPRFAYALTAVIGAVIIGIAQLAFSIASTQSTYEVRTLTEQQRELRLQQQSLADEVAGLSSPQLLAANASSLGMVVAGSPTYLRLSDGKVIGSPQAPAKSSVNPLGYAVPNALVSETPLVGAPDRTITGDSPQAKARAEALAKNAAEQQAKQPKHANLPPAVSDGLPVPETH